MKKPISLKSIKKGIENREKNGEKELLTEEVNPCHQLEINQEVKPSTSKQNCSQKDSIRRSESPPYENVSLHSISSSSTNLSSPPRAFPKRSKIVPEKKVSYQIQLRKSRWEPISSGEERRRFESLKPKKVKKMKKKTQTKGKRRKEMVNESHRGGGYFYSFYGKGTFGRAFKIDK